MKLIIGLGNPGKKYERTWHNAGFLALDEIAISIGADKFKDEKKFSALVGVGKYGREKIILAKPSTFMNNSGLAVSALMQFYKISLEDVIVVHDDIDLPLGKIRISLNSSAGGHNGIKSIIENLKSKEFVRVKIGVKTGRFDLMDTADYVLEKIDFQNFKYLKEEIKKASEATLCAIDESPEAAMNLYN